MHETALPAGSMRRIEDERLITGRGQYVDDVRLPERPAMLHVAFVRSPYAHARITGIRLDAAKALPGVVDALTGADLGNVLRPAAPGMPLPSLKVPQRWPLAVDRARYVGDPVAAVLAESPVIAQNARDLVEVDYAPLPAAADVEAAAAPDAPLLYDDFGSNIAFETQVGGGDIEAAFAQADRIVTLRLVNQRLAPASLEPRSCLFDYQPETGEFHAWLSSQAIYGARDLLAATFGLDRARVHVINADVGGGFGSKTRFVGEELVAARLALAHGRPVKWIETRSENLQTQTHGRGQVSYVEAAVRSDGLLLGLKVRVYGDLGAFITPMTAMVPARMPSLLCGPYRVQAVAGDVAGVFTNKVPTAPYRGAGRPEAAYIVERTMQRIAAELDLDPAEVRRRNLLTPDVFPYRTPTGLTYDSGNYQAVLDRALELADYQGWREQQRARREAHDPRVIGIGLATFIESSGGAMAGPGAPQEAATVRILTDGTLLVQSGVATNGQGHFTAFTQIAASVFDLPPSKVVVRMNDSDLPAFGIGTFGSRTLQTSGTAVLLAVRAVREKALRLVASQLEVDPADLVIADGAIMVQGVPASAISLGELARRVEAQPDLIEHEPPNPANGAPIEGLAAWRDFAPAGPTIGFGAYVAVVEVDTETGEPRIVRFVAVDDTGRVLNPLLAEGQVHGGLAQGIGQALYEEAGYDVESGQPLNGTLLDYALPSAPRVPDFVTDMIATPSPLNPLGAKGIGEAGTIGAPPAVVNAVLDALAPFGITALDMPLTAAKVWAAIAQARETGADGAGH
jgi:carbon-monoxide dehydrogenase large subunit